MEFSLTVPLARLLINWELSLVLLTHRLNDQFVNLNIGRCLNAVADGVGHIL